MSSALPTIKTERLLLRPFELWDAKEVQRLAGDFRIADTTLRIPHPYEDGMAEAWIAKQAEVSLKDSEIVFAIIRKEDAALVGAVGLANISHPSTEPNAELGYWIGVPYWNQGYCTEAGKALLNFAFHQMGLKRVHANHFARNPSSGRVLEKLGMRRVGPGLLEKNGKLEEVMEYVCPNPNGT